MHNLISYRKWDSDFFERKVGVVENDGELTGKELYEYLAISDYEIVYIFSSKALDVDYLDLVERKLTFSKDVSQVSNQNSSFIKTIDSDSEMNDSLLDLVYLSGHLSRFKLDKRFPSGSFKKMYRLWIEKSMSREMAIEVLGYYIKNELVGFVTIGSNGSLGIATIGLVSVSPDHSGKGIGKSLMLAAERVAYSLGYKVMNVVTQGANIPAVNLYRSVGYRLEKETFLYHYFKN